MKTRLLLSTLALFFAVGVLALSLIEVQAVYAGNKTTTERKQLYFGKDILPDNLMYPALMAIDRIQLETAPNSERIFLEMEYANRRLGYAQQLLNDNKESLALTTALKAENYLQNAVHDAQVLQAPSSVTQRLSKTLLYHIQQLKELSPKFTDSNRSEIDKIIEQDQIVQHSL